jgi:hypothetical protein
MVSPVSPLGGAPSSNSAMRQQSSIVAPHGGSLTASTIARLTGVTEGGAYQMLLVALVEAERRPPDEYLDVLGLTR